MPVWSVFDSGYDTREYIGYVTARDLMAAKEIVTLVYKKIKLPGYTKGLELAFEGHRILLDEYEKRLKQIEPRNYLEKYISFEEGIIPEKDWEINWIGDLNMAAVMCDECLKKLHELEAKYVWK